MGKAPHKAEDKNVEIYLRVKPTPKASRNVTVDLVRGEGSFFMYLFFMHYFYFSK